MEETATRGEPALATGAAAAFAVDRGRGEEVILAAEATRQGVTALKDPAAGEALVSALLARVAEQHEIAPIEVVVVRPGRLPRTSSGKIRRSAALAEWEDTASSRTSSTAGRGRPVGPRPARMRRSASPTGPASKPG